jgi:hypothetical protein
MMLLFKGDIVAHVDRPENPCEVLCSWQPASGWVGAFPAREQVIFVMDKRTLLTTFAAADDYALVRRPGITKRVAK